MSLLSPERLRVTLAPTAVRLARERGRWRRHATDRAVLPCDPGGDGPPWQGALAVLQGALGLPRWQRAPLALTLSDRLVRYQLLPWLPELGNPTERQGYARFHFRQVYGALADDWEIRVDETPPGTPAIACAADRPLLEALAALAEGAGAPIDGIRPGFAAVFNHLRRRLPTAAGEVTVLALLEPGGLCFGLLDGGRWRALRQRSPAAAPEAALREALEQERLLADPPFDQATVYLVTAGEGEGELPELPGTVLTVHRLALVGELPEWSAGS